MYDAAPGHFAALTAALILFPIAWTVLVGIRFGPGHRLFGVDRIDAGYRAASPMTKAAAALMLFTGIMHLALVPGHLQVEGFTAFLFVLDGAGFVILSGAAFLTARWRRPAALWLTATIIAYVVWVVAGWEAPDQVGIATKLVELVALGLVMRLAVPSRRTWPRRIWRAVSLPLVTTLATMGVWAGGLAHPDALHVHVGAVLQPVSSVTTPEQQAAAARLLAETRASLARYQDPATAIAAGFEPGPVSSAEPLLHFANKANADVILDPNQPQDLVYARTSHGLLLIGAMYQMPRIGLRGPDPGGPLTQWHQHEGICFTPFGFEFSLETPFWTCPVGSISITTPPMLHVWIIENPKGGPFSADLDPKVQRQLESR